MCVVCVPVRGVCGGGGLHTRVAPLSLTASFTLPTPLSYISPSGAAAGSGRRSASTSDSSPPRQQSASCAWPPQHSETHSKCPATFMATVGHFSTSAQQLPSSAAARPLTDGPLSTARAIIAGECLAVDNCVLHGHDACGRAVGDEVNLLELCSKSLLAVPAERVGEA